MNGLEAFSLSRKRNCDFYKRKIAALSPPENAQDERMIRIYQHLLGRDRALLEKLGLLDPAATPPRSGLGQTACLRSMCFDQTVALDPGALGDPFSRHP